MDNKSQARILVIDDDSDIYNGPIIVLTQLDNPDILKLAEENGAKGYLIKSSLRPDMVLEKVEELLSKS